jgi:hypothetical protein
LWHSGLPGLVSIKNAHVFLFFPKKEGTTGCNCVWIARITCFHSSGSFILKQKQKDYPHELPPLLPRPSGQLRQPKKEHAMPENLRPHALRCRGHLPHPLSSLRCVWTQAPPAWSSPLGKVTQWQPTQNGSPLAPVASIWPSSSFAAVDIATAREDGPSTLSSTKSQTHAVEVYRASSSSFASTVQPAPI